MAFDVTKFGVGSAPGTQSWGTTGSIDLPGTGAGASVKPYAFDGSKAPGNKNKKPKTFTMMIID